MPDILKWNTHNIKDIEGIFDNFNSLFYLPDIIRWDTSNVNNFQITLNLNNFSVDSHYLSEHLYEESSFYSNTKSNDENF